MKGVNFEMLKKEKGITLVALIITIIILLILAVVTINLILGENRNFNASRKNRKSAKICNISRTGAIK